MKLILTKVRAGLYRDDQTGIEIARATCGGEIEWVGTAPASDRSRTWLTTQPTLKAARADIERGAH